MSNQSWKQHKPEILKNRNLNAVFKKTFWFFQNFCFLLFQTLIRSEFRGFLLNFANLQLEAVRYKKWDCFHISALFASVSRLSNFPHDKCFCCNSADGAVCLSIYAGQPTIRRDLWWVVCAEEFIRVNNFDNCHFEFVVVPPSQDFSLLDHQIWSLKSGKKILLEILIRFATSKPLYPPHPSMASSNEFQEALERAKRVSACLP